jgi:hypothetical protein
MRNIILALIVFFTLSSCSLNDDVITAHYENLPVEQVEIPIEFRLGETYPITIWYKRPTTCHSFNGFYYEKDLNVRTIAVNSLVYDNTSCEDISPDQLYEATLDFYVTSNGSYVFKFWQGKNDQGEDVFLEYEIPVVY